MGFGIRIPSLGIKTGSLVGGSVGNVMSNVANTGRNFAQGGFGVGAAVSNSPYLNFVKGGGLLGVAKNALGGQEEAPVTSSGIPDFTNQWEALAQNLNTKQKAADAGDLQKAIGANAATQRSNLAMRGGLTAGASERLASNANQDFANAYSNLATKYGLGSAELSKQAIETRQEMELQKAMGQDRVNALRQANSGGFLSNLPLVGGLFK